MTQTGINLSYNRITTKLLILCHGHVSLKRPSSSLYFTKGAKLVDRRRCSSTSLSLSCTSASRTANTTLFILPSLTAFLLLRRRNRALLFLLTCQKSTFPLSLSPSLPPSLSSPPLKKRR